MGLEGKVALITGGNSGIGRGIVHRFVDEGARVALVGRDERKGAAVADEVKRRSGVGAFFAVDLARESSVAALVDDVVRLVGAIDIVVNNAGVGARRAGVEVDDGPGARWDKMRGPNLDAAYFVSAYALPLLKRSGIGAIVNISSTAARHGNWGLYCVAKAAQPPSGSSSGQWEWPPSLLGRMGTPTEIAAAVLFLASEEASFITGQTLIVDGGLAVTDYSSRPLLRKVGANLFSGQL